VLITLSLQVAVAVRPVGVVAVEQVVSELLRLLVLDRHLP
jgi:hypothetical protein